MPNDSTATATLATTEWWEQATRSNALVCFGVGMPLNVLLCWAIVKRSPGELRAYRKVLLQTAILDTIFLLVSFLVQPVSAATVRRCQVLLTSVMTADSTRR